MIQVICILVQIIKRFTLSIILIAILGNGQYTGSVSVKENLLEIRWNTLFGTIDYCSSLQCVNVLGSWNRLGGE